MAFKGARPKGQPRTLRTVAEDKGSTPAARSEGMYEDTPKPGGEYHHDAGAGNGPQGKIGNAADPEPFGNLKGH